MPDLVPDPVGAQSVASSATPRVPGFRIVARLGEGGMGRVYAAEQLAPVRREVALKVIKWGMDTEEVIARFESERQALAMMDHPSIARVFEAGATDSGRPYFVMELVDGAPIIEYCDNNRMPLAARLELFVRICEGVQHAHQKGIIHRDLKPSNVIVKLQDGVAIPKIIDFGLAKATDQRLTERTIFTEYGQLIGTPDFMAPEQAAPSALDVDTRADIYSLGVLLYELLTGARPVDSTDPRVGLDEIRRRICEEEPRPPSSRMSDSNRPVKTAAETRATDPKSLARRLRGELDWIIMKALEKDRERRYPTASDLALDIKRHLQNEPVLASPPSRLYRFVKLLRRQRVAISTATVVLVALITGSVMATIGLLRARAAEGRARIEAEAALQISEFLTDIFEVSDPAEMRGRELTAREILAHGAKKIDEDLRDRPLTQARLQKTIGDVYQKMGLFAEAVPFLEKALATRRRWLDPDDLEIADAANALGDLYRKQSRFDEGEPLLREALDIRQRALGERHQDTVSALNNLAVLYDNAGRYSEAEPLLRRTVELWEGLLEEPGGEAVAMRIDPLTNLAILTARQGRPDEAEPMFRRALAITEATLGPDDPVVALACSNLGIVLKMQNEYAEAESLYRRSLSLRRRVLLPGHPDIARSESNLANLLKEQGRFDEAEQLYERALDIAEESLGAAHPDVARTLGNLAVLYMEQERFDDAEALYRRVLPAQEQALGLDHPEVAMTLFHIGNLRRFQNRPQEAEPYYRRSLEISHEVLDPGHPDLALVRDSYADLLRELGRDAEAEQLIGSAQGPTQ